MKNATCLPPEEFDAMVATVCMISAPPEKSITREEAEAMKRVFLDAQAGRPVTHPFSGQPTITDLRTGEVFVRGEA